MKAASGLSPRLGRGVLPPWVEAEPGTPGPIVGINAPRLLRPNPPLQLLLGVPARQGAEGRVLATGAHHVHCQSDRAPLTAVWAHTCLWGLWGGGVVFQKSNTSVS